MSSTSKGNALRLASTAQEMGADALRGTLEQNEAGHWTLSYVELESWLSRYAGQELVVAVAAIEPEAAKAYIRTCRTCGREYEGLSCPHCDEIRRRLRR